MNYKQNDVSWTNTKAGVFFALRNVSLAIRANRAKNCSPASGLYPTLRLYTTLQEVSLLVLVRALVDMQPGQLVDAIVWNPERGHWGINRCIVFTSEISVSVNEIVAEVTEWYRNGH